METEIILLQKKAKILQEVREVKQVSKMKEQAGAELVQAQSKMCFL